MSNFNIGQVVGFHAEGHIFRGWLVNNHREEDGSIIREIMISHFDGSIENKVVGRVVTYDGPILGLL